MAKNKVIFDDTNYSVEDESLAAATVELQSHLSTVMNGSGAVIKLGGNSYNVDSTKLSSATNTFVNHLGTVPGSGLNVVVGGVKYSVDSAKMSNAFSEIHAVLGGLHFDDDSSNEDVDAITWDGNTEGLLCVPIDDNAAFYKVSDKVFTNDQLRNASVSINMDGEIFAESMVPEWIWLIRDGLVTDSYAVLMGNVVVVRQASSIHDTMFPEVGTYFVKGADPYGTQILAISLCITDYDPNAPYLHVTGAYLDLTGRTTPRDGDKCEYGDYIYTYYKDSASLADGWNAKVNTAAIDLNQTTYGLIVESINGEPVTNMRQTFKSCINLTTAPIIPSNVINMDETFYGCTSLVDASHIVLPSNIRNLPETFSGCTSLVTAPIIPSNLQEMGGTFEGCTSLVTAPDLSNCTQLESMTNTFTGCTSLTVAPVIPESVRQMYGTFEWCTSLVAAPVIPSNVSSMENTFRNCTSLTGIIEINGSCEYDCSKCFYNVDFEAQNITLTGSSINLDKIGSTGKNYCSTCNGKCQNNH